MDGVMSLYSLESVYALVLVWLLWSPIFYEDIKKPTRRKEARKECGKQEIDGPVHLFEYFYTFYVDNLVMDWKQTRPFVIY